MNTCALCLGTVAPGPDGELAVVGEPFIAIVPHRHALMPHT